MLAFVAERVFSLALMKYLIQDVSAEVFGIWTQIVSVSGLVNILFMLRLDNALLTVLANKDKDRRKLYFLLASISILPLSFLAYLGVLIFGDGLSTLIFGAPSYHYLLIPILLLSISEAFGYLSYAYLRVMQLQRLVSLHYFVRFSGRSILLILLLVQFELSLVTSLYWLCVFGVVIAIASFLPGANHLPSSDELKDVFRRASKEGIAQLFVAIIYWLIANIDRYVIVYFIGLKDMAIFAFLTGIAAPISLLPSILQSSLLPALSKASHEKNDRFNQLSTDLFKVNLFIGLAAIAGLVAVSPLLVQLIGSTEFQLNEGLFLLVGIVMLATSFDLILGGMFTARRQSTTHLKISLLSLVFYVLLLIWVVPRYGLAGMLTARLATLLIGSSIMCVWLNYNPIQKDVIWQFMRWTASAIFMCAILVYLPLEGFFNNGWLELLLLVFAGVSIYFLLNMTYVRADLRSVFLRNYSA